MPKRRTTRRRKRKRKFKRKRRFRRNRQLIPSKTVKTFVYSDVISLNAGLAGIAVHNFSCNGMFDPDTSGIGHQPLGFDEYLNVFYNHYTVIHCKIECMFYASGDTAATGNLTCCVGVRSATGYANDLNTLVEQGRTRTVQLSNADASAVKRITYQINPNRFLGVSKPLASSNVRATHTTNPAEQCYWLILVAPADQSSDPSTVACQVKITYRAVLTEPVLLAGS